MQAENNYTEINIKCVGFAGVVFHEMEEVCVYVCVCGGSIRYHGHRHKCVIEKTARWLF